MSRKFRLLFVLCLLHYALFAQSDGSPRIKISGFGDITAGTTFGKYANQTSYDLFQKYGDYYYPYGMRNGLSVHGIDFLTTVYLNDAIKIQAETAIYGARAEYGGAMALDIDRCYVDYNISEKFSLQAGLIYTPIGYVNRNLYSRAWLMNSAYIYQAVEQSAGLIQSHFVGVNGYGTLARSAKGSELTYMAAVGMPRPASPTAQIFSATQKGYQATLLLEGHFVKKETDIKFGLSGYTDEIHTYYVPGLGNTIQISDTSTNLLVLQETGFNPYLVIKGGLFELITEFDHVMTNVTSGYYPRKNTTLDFFTCELTCQRKLGGKRFAPYVRYDRISLPADGGPYYGLRLTNGIFLEKNYTPDFSAVIAGVAYDVAGYNRIKLEYVHHFDGPYVSNGLFIQTAFGF